MAFCLEKISLDLLVLALFGNPENISLSIDLPSAAFVLFQMGFSVACVSIVSGAVAERMNFKAYIVTASPYMYDHLSTFRSLDLE